MTDPTALPNFGANEQQKTLRELIQQALANLELENTIDDDGDVRLTHQGQTLFIRGSENNPMIRVYGQWQIGDDVTSDQLERYEAAGDLSIRLNLVKLMIHNEMLYAAVDLLIVPGTPLEPVLANSITVLLQSIQTWFMVAGGKPVDEAIAELTKVAEEARAQAEDDAKGE